MPIVNIEWLNKKAQKLVKKHWDLDVIPNIVLDVTSDEEWNKLDKDIPNDKDWTTFGIYHSKTQTIEFNSKVNENRALKEIEKTLLHELCHWYLHINQMSYRDRDIRFALELIRVGAKPSGTEIAKQAYKEAKEKKQKETFELIEKNDSEIIAFRMKHPTKNEDDFKKDLRNTLIRMYNEKQERQDDSPVFVGDVEEKMAEWYGYKLLPISTFAFVFESSSFGDVLSRDETIYNLNELGLDNSDAEKILLPEYDE